MALPASLPLEWSQLLFWVQPWATWVKHTPVGQIMRSKGPCLELAKEKAVKKQVAFVFLLGGILAIGPGFPSLMPMRNYPLSGGESFSFVYTTSCQAMVGSTARPNAVGAGGVVGVVHSKRKN